jgi:DNA-binding MarR family transcriptional regulator
MNNLGDLEIFARVVSAGSMSAAGRELGLSPAVVSKRLRRLEDRLGTRLMQRTTRQISLTEAGQGFYERVVAILAGIEEAEAFVSRRSALARGVLKVSAPTSFGRMHIAPHINAFMQRKSRSRRQSLMLRDEFVDIVGDGYDLAIQDRGIERFQPGGPQTGPGPPHSGRSARLPQSVNGNTAEDFEDLDRHVCLVTRRTTTPGSSKVLSGSDGPPAEPGRCRPIPAKWSAKPS